MNLTEYPTHNYTLTTDRKLRFYKLFVYSCTC